MPSLSEANSAGARNERKTKFVGQITDKLAENIFVIWDLDGNRSFDAYHVLLSDLSVGDLVNCALSNDLRYVAKVERVDEKVREAYCKKQLHLR